MKINRIAFLNKKTDVHGVGTNGRSFSKSFKRASEAIEFMQNANFDNVTFVYDCEAGFDRMQMVIAHFGLNTSHPQKYHTSDIMTVKVLI